MRDRIDEAAIVVSVVLGGLESLLVVEQHRVNGQIIGLLPDSRLVLISSSNTIMFLDVMPARPIRR